MVSSSWFLSLLDTLSQNLAEGKISDVYPPSEEEKEKESRDHLREDNLGEEDSDGLSL